MKLASDYKLLHWFLEDPSKQKACNGRGEEVESWRLAKASFTEFLSMDKGGLLVCLFLFLTHPHTFQWELARQFFLIQHNSHPQSSNSIFYLYLDVFPHFWHIKIK